MSAQHNRGNREQPERSQAGMRTNHVSPEAFPKGQLFVVASDDNDNGKASRLVMNIIHEVYYADQTQDIDESLKQALEDARNLVQELFNQNPSKPKHQINCACLVLTKDRVYSAQIGNNCIYRINHQDFQRLNKSNQSNGRRYRFQESSRQKTTVKMNGVVETNSSFLVQAGDCFLLSTKVLDNIEQRRIRKILLSKTPPQARQELLDLLRKSGCKDTVDLEVIRTNSNAARSSVKKASPRKELGWLAAIFLGLFSLLLLLNFMGDQPEKNAVLMDRTEPDNTNEYTPILKFEAENAIDDEDLQQRITDALDARFKKTEPEDIKVDKTEPAPTKSKIKKPAKKSKAVDSKSVKPPATETVADKPTISSSRARFLRRWDILLPTDDFSVDENEFTFLNTKNRKRVLYYASLKNFIFEVKTEPLARNVKGRYGIILGYQAGNGSPYEEFYLFSVSDQKELLLQKYFNFRKELITRISLSDYAFRDAKSMQLKVKCDGRKLVIYANHQLLYIHTQSEDIEGRVGLFADAGLRVTFSDLEFSKIVNLKNITNVYEQDSQN